MIDTKELNSNLPSGTIFIKISKLSIFLLAFLLPLFFLPFNVDILEFPKQAFLFILTSISLINFIIRVSTLQDIELRKNLVNIAILILGVVFLISTIFSTFSYGSFWGYPLSPSQGLFTLIVFAFFYFVASNIFEKREVIFLVLTIILSGFIVSAFFLLQLLVKLIPPFDILQRNSFTLFGSPNSLAILDAILLVLILPLMFFVRGFFKIILSLFAISFLVTLLIVNFDTAWIVFVIGIAILISLLLTTLKSWTNKISTLYLPLLVTLLILGSFFIFLKFDIFGIKLRFAEIFPSQKAMLMILNKFSPKELAIGTGLGTFSYVWMRDKPPEINQTVFWSTGFPRGFSEVSEKTITTGLIGTSAFIFLIAVCFFQFFFNVITKKDEIHQGDEKSIESEKGKSALFDKSIIVGVLAAFSGLITSFFLYPANISLLFLFWLMVVFAALLGQQRKYTLNFKHSPFLSFLSSFLIIAVLISLVGLSIVYAKKYIADVLYNSGLSRWMSGDVEKSAVYLEKATALNPKIDLYWRDLAQIYLVQLQQVLQRTDLTTEERNSLVQSLVIKAVNSISLATTVYPNSDLNWITRGFVYRSLIGILGGADEWALSSYEKAKELNRISPYIFTEIGKTYLAKADFLNQQQKTEEVGVNIKLAQQSLEKALELKPDYAPAHFQLAVSYIRENKIAEAIEGLEKAKLATPLDAGIAFQLGVLYYNSNRIDQAKSEFERAVLIDQNYSNARYFLGLILDKEGKKQEAIKHFEKIEALNPENSEVKKILQNLRSGKEALEGVSQSLLQLEK